MTANEHAGPWTFVVGHGPVIALAIHAGHELRPQVAQHMALSAEQRFREEDPYTGDWTAVGDGRVLVHRSRFEVDMNRPRDRAVYAAPVDCWNLKVSSGPVPPEVVAESLRLYDRFYEELFDLLEAKARAWRHLLVLDLHSYNHRRSGPGMAPDDPALNPEINVGTAGAGRQELRPLIDRFLHDLRSFEVAGRPLDVRENVKFRGGHLVRWIGSRFPQACPLAVEVKKIYMDELTGDLDANAWTQIYRALDAATEGCRERLRNPVS